MAAGKLSVDRLKSLIGTLTGAERPEVRLSGAVGEDAGAVALDGHPDGPLCVVSSDPVTGAGQNAGRIAVQVAVNDVAATGAEPVAVLVTILLPEGYREDKLAVLVDDLNRAARDLQVSVIGGHTEVTPKVNGVILSLTAIGRAPTDGLITSSGLGVGDRIIMTKGAGYEGTGILAADYEEELLSSGKISAQRLEQARGLATDISIVPEARLAAGMGTTALHDVTEGGVAGALWELAEAAQLGLRIHATRIPIHPATRSICAAAGLDPLRLIGSGSLLIGIPLSHRQQLMEQLDAAGIPAADIGVAVPAAEGRLLVTESGEAVREEPIQPPEGDELWTLD